MRGAGGNSLDIDLMHGPRKLLSGLLLKERALAWQSVEKNLSGFHFLTGQIPERCNPASTRSAPLIARALYEPYALRSRLA